MAQPTNATLTIDDISVDAFYAHFGMRTRHDGTGMPAAAQQLHTIFADIDIHDTGNVPFQSLRRMFELAHTHTREHVRPMRITFWTDDGKTDVICSYAFDGWISKFLMASGGGANHILHLCLALKQSGFAMAKVELGN